MKPNEHDPRGYMVIHIDLLRDGHITCFHSFRYHVAKQFKDKCVALEQRRKHKRQYLILPMTKQDYKGWRELPF